MGSHPSMAASHPSASSSCPVSALLPKLSKNKKEYSYKNNGFFKCCQTQAGHFSHDCLNPFPNAAIYVSLLLHTCPHSKSKLFLFIQSIGVLKYSSYCLPFWLHSLAYPNTWSYWLGWHLMHKYHQDHETKRSQVDQSMQQENDAPIAFWHLFQGSHSLTRHVGSCWHVISGHHG